MLFLCMHIFGVMEVLKESYAVFVYTHSRRNRAFKRELCRFVSNFTKLAFKELPEVLHNLQSVGQVHYATTLQALPMGKTQIGICHRMEFDVVYALNEALAHVVSF